MVAQVRLGVHVEDFERGTMMAINGVKSVHLRNTDDFYCALTELEKLIQSVEKHLRVASVSAGAMTHNVLLKPSGHNALRILLAFEI